MWISQLPLVNLLQFWKGLPTPNCHQATKTVLLILHFRGMICQFGMWCSRVGRCLKVKLVLLLARVVGMHGWKVILPKSNLRLAWLICRRWLSTVHMRFNHFHHFMERLGEVLISCKRGEAFSCPFALWCSDFVDYWHIYGFDTFLKENGQSNKITFREKHTARNAYAFVHHDNNRL